MLSIPKPETSLDGGRVTYVAGGNLPGGSSYHFINWPSQEALGAFQGGLIRLAMAATSNDEGREIGPGQVATNYLDRLASDTKQSETNQLSEGELTTKLK